MYEAIALFLGQSVNGHVELRELLGLRGRETRALVRRLKAIAAERAPNRPFPFFKLVGRWTIPR
jgi:hypothetical protein